jgi:Ca2+-binding RTX toxin-like protein
VAKRQKPVEFVKLTNGDDFHLGGENVDGKRGDDTLLALGDSTLRGGRGADKFAFIYLTAGTTIIKDFNRAEGDMISVLSSRPGKFENIGWLLVDNAFSPEAMANGEAGQIVQVANSDGTYTLSFYYSKQEVSTFDIIVNTKIIPSDFRGGNGVQYPVNPTENADNIVGFNGVDRIDLLSGDDTYDGLSGNDEIYGGAGNDTLRAGNPIGTTIGGSKIYGGSGTDVLIAGSAQDILNGGGGGDAMYGGGGADRFVYLAVTDSTRVNNDVIHDFSSFEGDKIDLSAIDADTLLEGNQAFTFIDGAFCSRPGELRSQIDLSGPVASTYVYGDVDGDGVADFVLQILGSGPQAADFIF